MWELLGQTLVSCQGKLRGLPRLYLKNPEVLKPVQEAGDELMTSYWNHAKPWAHGLEDETRGDSMTSREVAGSVYKITPTWRGESGETGPLECADFLAGTCSEMKLLGFTQAPARLSEKLEEQNWKAKGHFLLAFCCLWPQWVPSSGQDGVTAVKPSLSPCAVPVAGVTWLSLRWAAQSHSFVSSLVWNSRPRGAAGPGPGSRKPGLGQGWCWEWPWAPMTPDRTRDTALRSTASKADRRREQRCWSEGRVRQGGMRHKTKAEKT